MELSLTDQLTQLIQRSNSFLIALPENPQVDAVASALALAMYLQKLGKQAQVAASGGLPLGTAFLPHIDALRNHIEINGTLTVLLDTSRRQLAELSYDTKENQVAILLKAVQGAFSPSDVSFSTSTSGVDAVFVLGAQSLEQLGSLFTENAEFLYELPKINIDNNPTNEYFGTINVVDITAVAVAEILADLFTSTNLTDLDADIATALLTGIVTNTSSFQSTRTTPQAFTKASELIAQGARQQDIIQHLFKTKELSLLKLWGRALARLKTLPGGIAITALNAGDFEKTDSSDSLLPQVLQEFLDNVAGFKVFCVIAELPTVLRVLVSSHPQLQQSQLNKALAKTAAEKRLPTGQSYLEYLLPMQELSQAETMLTTALTQSMPQS